MRVMKSLITLAIVCLLAVPAFSMPSSYGKGYGGWCGAGDFLTDLSDEEMMNMTLSEIEALRQAKIDELNNMTLSELKELWGGDDNVSYGRHILGSGACLLVTDLMPEDLKGMTLAEIEALREAKIDELNNMTLSEIEALREEKLAEMDNMTLSEIKEQQEVCHIIMNHIRQNPHEMAGPGGSDMPGPGGCQFNQHCMGFVGANEKGMMNEWGWGGDQFGMKGFGHDGRGSGR
jgi:hypothetical protein